MKKNVAGQKIGAQLVEAADGDAFTGAVTVYVTGDAGAQTVGSVGGGACTHEGNGYHTYAPAQAETNYDLVAFTFVGTAAVPVTVQIYTSFPQSGDAPTAAAIAAAVLAAVVEGSYTVQHFLRGFAAALLGKLSGVDAGTPTFRDTGDTKNRIAATADETGRPSVTLDLT